MDRLVNAWRGDADDDTITGVGEKGSTAGLGVQHEGNQSTINGYPGHLRRGADGKLVCQPDAGDGKRRVPRDEPDDDDGEQSAEQAVRNASTHTESTVRRDHRSVQQLEARGAAVTSRLYDEIDAELRDASLGALDRRKPQELRRRLFLAAGARTVGLPA